MKTLGIVPARKGSQRFPNKHHALLLGEPMFSYTLKAARESERLDRIVISSDDPKLKPLADQYGAEFLERPPELCTDTAALEDAVRQVCRLLKARDGFQPDLILTMQGNVPVRKEGQMDQVIGRLEGLPQATAVCTAQEVRQRPEWTKVIKNQETAEVAPYLPGFTAYRTQDYPPLFMVDGAIVGVRWQTLFASEGNRAGHAWLGDRLSLMVQEHPMYSLEVDYPDQLVLAEFYLVYQRLGERWVDRNAFV